MKDKVGIVMLVDDNDTDNFINKRVIELTGFANDIIVKNSGKSALEYLENEKDNLEKLPDLIFLDINMPMLDGWEFLSSLSKLNIQEKINSTFSFFRL